MDRTYDSLPVFGRLHENIHYGIGWSGNGVTGIWECTPGRFRRQVEQAEYSYIVSGEGRFTPDEGQAV
ncbi:cupin domain-containing protein, partial [Pseudomonas aeruginosa]|uniref:cupin domain-containing protein n=1 Tax=Pseudomonas aeruginosa TaxID=287 RepID=UPI001CD9ACAA